MTAMLAGDWITWRLHGVATALRGAAAALEGLADMLDPDAAAHAGAAAGSETGDAHVSRAGTRERIAEALQRARSRYDAVTMAPDAAKIGPRRPRRRR